VAGRASQSAAKAKPDRSLALERAVVLGRTSATMASQGEPAGVVAARPNQFVMNSSMSTNRRRHWVEPAATPS